MRTGPRVRDPRRSESRRPPLLKSEGAKNFLFGQPNAAPVGRCGAPPRAAPLTHAPCGRLTTRASARASTRRTAPRRSGPTSSPPAGAGDAFICRSCSQGRSNTHRLPCAPTAAHTRTARPQATHFERTRPTHGSRRRSATRAPTTHNSAPDLICTTAERRECTLGYDTSFTEWEPRCDNSR